MEGIMGINGGVAAGLTRGVGIDIGIAADGAVKAVVAVVLLVGAIFPLSTSLTLRQRLLGFVYTLLL